MKNLKVQRKSFKSRTQFLNKLSFESPKKAIKNNRSYDTASDFTEKQISVIVKKKVSQNVLNSVKIFNKLSHGSEANLISNSSQENPGTSAFLHFEIK